MRKKGIKKGGIPLMTCGRHYMVARAMFLPGLHLVDVVFEKEGHRCQYFFCRLGPLRVGGHRCVSLAHKDLQASLEKIYIYIDREAGLLANG